MLKINYRITKKGVTLFKVNSKDIKMTSMTSF